MWSQLKEKKLEWGFGIDKTIEKIDAIDIGNFSGILDKYLGKYGAQKCRKPVNKQILYMLSMRF